MLQGLYTGLSGLISHRKALDLTSYNIANVNTEGYTKQRANFSTNPIKDEWNIQMGTGSHIQSVTRIHDEMLFSSMKSTMKQNSEFSEAYKKLSTVNDIVKEGILGDNSLIDLTEQFFEYVQDIAANPESNSPKVATKELASSLFERASALNNDLDKYKQTLKDEYYMLEKEANSYLNQLDTLSKEIHNIEALNPHMVDKEYANDLRDQRDLLEEKFKETFDPMAEKINEFVSGDMSKPNELLDWYLGNDTTKGLESIAIGFSTTVDGIKSSMNSTETILSQLQMRHDEMSKVNIDEEMTNMIRYQRSFEANAKVISTYDEMLGTLLDMKR